MCARAVNTNGSRRPSSKRALALGHSGDRVQIVSGQLDGHSAHWNKDTATKGIFCVGWESA